jgi:hypothetical protein
MTEFTPVSAIIGGLLIGGAAAERRLSMLRGGAQPAAE